MNFNHEALLRLKQVFLPIPVQLHRICRSKRNCVYARYVLRWFNLKMRTFSLCFHGKSLSCGCDRNRTERAISTKNQVSHVYPPYTCLGRIEIDPFIRASSSLFCAKWRGRFATHNESTRHVISTNLNNSRQSHSSRSVKKYQFVLRLAFQRPLWFADAQIFRILKQNKAASGTVSIKW